MFLAATVVGALAVVVSLPPPAHDEDRDDRRDEHDDPGADADHAVARAVLLASLNPVRRRRPSRASG